MAGAGILAEGPTLHHRAAPSMQGVGKSAVKRSTADLPEQREETPSSSLRPSGQHLPLWPKYQDPSFQDREPHLPPVGGAGKPGRPISAKLRDLGISAAFWKTANSEALPRMEGAGKRARNAAAGEAAEEAQEGDNAGDKAKPGRRSAEETAATYTSHSTIACDEVLDKQAFLRMEKTWAQNLVEGECLNIRHNFLPFKDGFKLSQWCNSCASCCNKAGWKGYSTHNAAERKTYRQYTPVTAHGDFAATRQWNPLTATTENALKAFVRQNAHFTTQDLVKIVETHQPANRPPDAWLQTWGRNHREHKGTTSDKLSSMRWVEADWRQVERTLGKTDSLVEVVNQLKVAASLYDPMQTIVVFCNPLLLTETLNSLTNKCYIKLCGDGTFRLTDGDWVLMTVGVLSKHYARSEGIYAFSTTFNPLIFGLANKESEVTYQVLFQSLCECSRRFAGIDLQACVRQYHADMHPGEDLAQRSMFANACRVADWAHVIGACTRPKQKVTKDAHDERVNVYHSGVFNTVKKKLSPAGQKLLPLVERAFHCMRSLPTALLFHTCAQMLLATLTAQDPPEGNAANALEKHYFVRLDAEDARSQFDLEDWPGDPTRILIAEWWCGIQRLQPGSASGTQAQESWHRHKLKKYLGLRTALPTFVESLDNFAKSRLADLQSQGSCLPDMPQEPFPDKTVMWDSAALTQEGRSSADQFYRNRAWDRCEDVDGTIFYCMPRTLATYNHDTKCWEETPDNSIRRPSLGSAGAFSSLLRARSEAAVIRALVSLGCVIHCWT